MGMTLFTLMMSSAMAETGKLGFWEKLNPPVDISTHGHLIDWLFNYTTALNLFFFSLVCAGLFGFSFLYRRKRHPKPYYTYGNKKPQIMLATVIGVAVFVGIDMNITRMSNNDYIGVFTNWPSESEDILRVEVLGQQWAWNFRYAGKDGLFNTDDDVVTLNDLRVPVGKKVVFQVLSKDVIHSLYFPNARRKVDAIPGRLTRLWYELTKTGEYDIACAEMCGTYHYRMQAKLTVYTQEDYDNWMNHAQEHAFQTNDPENAELFWGWAWQ
ncbi:MAG: cytochrome c oxidase subunit II [Bdellovibrio sp. CG12_big_fil_rev_8_21_14_0_65_39_13]|nr:MAG: cytochrome c oxidase subunit II [Bdellovibrio sp. CG22_combo_CG10-13_8_21_14_all_39_27]PIQ61702.1 MAG: cytochrome c oxidase subunit II [Bdellovibrio sp. CG12_big_fil_rev_8_21_14_0_65_39_13]PIR35645.1 MAG: cytochrome c oxidase subunit II [Bdellovibrio sp. CG11_big_fil_rev_8_21_14_0_20_39_38]